MKYSFSDLSNLDGLSFGELTNNEAFYMQDCDVRIFYIFKSLYDSGSATFVSQQHSVSPSKVSRYIAEMREVRKITRTIAYQVASGVVVLGDVSVIAE